MTTSSITGLILVLAGIAAIFWRKTIVKERTAFNQFQFGTKYTSGDFKYGETTVVVVGALFAIFGFLVIFGVIELKT